MSWTSCLLAMCFTLPKMYCYKKNFTLCLPDSAFWYRFLKILGMAPAKKSRSIKKRLSPTTEISPSKDGNGDNAKKSLQRVSFSILLFAFVMFHDEACK